MSEPTLTITGPAGTRVTITLTAEDGTVSVLDGRLGSEVAEPQSVEQCMEIIALKTRAARHLVEGRQRKRPATTGERNEEIDDMRARGCSWDQIEVEFHPTPLTTLQRSYYRWRSDQK